MTDVVEVPEEDGAYRRTPPAERFLARSGDPLEKFAVSVVPDLFPNYEALWRELVWDITDRDYRPTTGQPRAAAPKDLRLFAQAHYTFLRSLLYVERSIAFPQISVVLPDTTGRTWLLPHPFELQYQNERFLNIYVHFGRVRDMTFQMLDTMGRAADLTTSLRKQGDQEFDTKLVLAFIRRHMPGTLADRFASWCAEVTHYRNVVHKIAAAVVTAPAEDGVPRMLVLRPALAKELDDWTIVLALPGDSFVPAEEIMRRHLAQLQQWGREVWDFFLKVVQGWSKDDATFRRRLNLPLVDSPQ